MKEGVESLNMPGIKRKRSKTDEAPSLDDLDAWNCCPRLQRHAEKLLSNPRPLGVLQRYKEKAHAQGTEKLQQFLVHVSAWVALLPTESTLLPACVELLSELLRLRGRVKLNTWLHGSLRLVGHRVHAGLRGELPSSASVDWKCLKKHLPKKVLDVQISQLLERSKVCVSSGSGGAEKSAQVLQKAISKWQMASEAKRQEMLTALRAKCEMPSSGDVEADRLLRLSIVQGLVGAMSPPLKASIDRAREEVASSSEQGNEAVSQQEVRRLLIQVLPKLDLADDLLQACLHRLKALISDFETRHAIPVKDAAQGRQWAQISQFLGLSPPEENKVVHRRWSDEEKEDFHSFMNARMSDGTPKAADFKAAAEHFKRPLEVVRKVYKLLVDPRYGPAEPSKGVDQKGLMKEIVQKATRCLGGNATIPELLSFIENDPEIQKTYGHRLQRSMTKIHGNIRLMPAWERTVRGNAGNMLQKTRCKREGRRVYELTKI